MIVPRWKLRLEQYQDALGSLAAGVAEVEGRTPSPLENQGLVRGFECTFELAWKMLRDFLREKGYHDVIGSRDTIREAFSEGLIRNDKVWISMIRDQRQTHHVYKKDMASAISQRVQGEYYSSFLALKDRMAGFLDAT